MARPLRIEYPNASYHVINRGNQHQTVFHDDWHYQRFTEKLGDFAIDFHVSVYAFCCMPNHFHLYLRTREANLSRFMQSFLTSFCVSSNKKRRTSGHIFQGRFKAHLVEDQLYRSRLSRYIHLNPVRIEALRDVTLEERHHYLRDISGQAIAVISASANRLSGWTVLQYCLVGGKSVASREPITPRMLKRACLNISKVRSLTLLNKV